ncbi:MAG: hypothetical protein GYA55_05805, partial [SAR324 cluster bacterium]|nr:hypothetical protein [SAR324 cluster bacterium]
MDFANVELRFNPVFINRFLRQGPLQQLVFAIRISLVIACILLLSFTLYDFLQNRIEAETASMKLKNELARLAEDKSQDGAKKRKRVETDVTMAKNLFSGLSPKLPGKDVATPKLAPQIQLTLVGTFIADDVKESYAIIEDQKKKIQEDFSLNDLIFGEAKLVGIYPDKVEIDRNGVKEFLKLDENDDSDT